jgi:murein DD-endopeptidase MepM/ murein hydrolase activator NlpD
MSEMFVVKGQTIKKGDRIGAVGMTGTATGNHLHFEVIVNNKKADPMNYLLKV